MTARKSTSSRSTATPKDDEVEETPEPVGKAVFVPSGHASGVLTPSGAVFSLSPQVAVKMSRTDAEDLAAAGFGSIQGG